MAYDSESKQVILFGGQIGDSFETLEFNRDTWAFDITNRTWTEMKPTESPRLGVANPIAYDSESDRIILYGLGATGRDTWSYDYNTNTWTKMKGRGPADHVGADMAYDAESDRVILFGGQSFDTLEYFNDTWAYDYNADTWSEMKPDVSPPGQNFHAMTYDAAADRIISWGGENSPPQPPPGYPPKDSSLWMYDYNTNTWQVKPSDGAPGARPYHGLAYVDSTDLVYLYGGYEGGTREMRTYDNKSNTWAFIEEPIPFPGALSRFAMVYVPETDQIIVFGGQVGGRQFSYTNNTWVYDVSTNTWTNVTREEP